jgi:hypothetical protein
MTRRGLTLSVIVLSLVVGLGACGSSGFRYVTNRKTGTYFKVPTEWKVFDQKAISAKLKANGVDPDQAVLFATAFDASPKPALEHFLQADPPPAQPAGVAQVRALSDSERDVVSLRALRNLIYNVDDGVAQSTVNVLAQGDLDPPSGLHGQRIVYEVQADAGKYIIDQSTLLDPKAQRVWVFAVSCQSACYMDQRSKIDKVVSSWTVKKR